MNEDALVRKLRRRWPLIGDDCAVIPGDAKEDLLLKSDFSIEGVHFTRDSKAAQIGYRAVARCLSDIGAMGGRPRYCLISFALAPWTNPSWIGGFYRGIEKLLRETKTVLVGGDISHARQFIVDVILCGSVAKGKALRRSGARAGDILYVSGPLGGWRHKRVIVPRLEEGRRLLGKATACMDISDGIALDLHRLALASGVAAEIDSLPLLKGASLEEALHSGEDYELLYTAPARVRVPDIAIGRVLKGKPGRVTFHGKPVPPLGYDHFQCRS